MTCNEETSPRCLLLNRNALHSNQAPLRAPQDWPGWALCIFLCLCPPLWDKPLLTVGTVDSSPAHLFWGQNWSNNSNNIKPPFWTTTLAWSVIFENILLYSLNGYLCLLWPCYLCALRTLWKSLFQEMSKLFRDMFTEAPVSVISEGTAAQMFPAQSGFLTSLKDLGGVTPAM